MASSSSTKPDREGFLRRLESGGDGDQNEAATPVASSKKVVRICDKKPLDDDDALRFLQQAGLGSAPVDPSSLAALRDICSPPREEEKTPIDEQPPLVEIQTNAVLFRRQTSDLTQSRLFTEDDARTDATTAGSTVEENRMTTSFDKSILRLLESQTALMRDFNNQLQDLKKAVTQLQRQLQTLQAQQQPVAQQQRRQQPAAGATAQPRAAVVQPREAVPQQQQQPQQHQMVLSRISEIVRVFWVMQRRQVVLDGGMLFKVLFMVLILSSRMGKKNKTAGFWSTYRMYFGVTLVVLGFLMQSGYMGFLHNFFVKQSIPARIWNGETINVDEAVAARPRQPVNEPRAPNQENAGGGGWRNTFFGGVIQPAGGADNNNNDENNRNGNNAVLGFLQDIVYLLGSFVLSILPMWKPEGIQRVDPAAAQEEEEEGQEEQEGDEEPEQHPPDQRDAMQPLEDEEDDIYGED